MEELGEVCDLDRAIQNKRVRWAASVYGRALPALRGIAEKVLREYLDSEVELRWMRGVVSHAEVLAVDFGESKVGEYSDGSRAEGPHGRSLEMVTAAATRWEWLYLGR